MAGPYRITIYTALPGTPLVDEYGNPKGTSAAGHMWYATSDGKTENSYGFAPKEHGATSGPGKGYDTDTNAYQNPAYARTMEITAEQYAKLKEFGGAALNEQWTHFNGEYKGLTNSCVDFTWGALKHAGLEIHRPQIAVHDGTVVTPEYRGPIESHFEGRLKPGHNKVDIQQIAAPVPGSPLNTEKTNPPPKDKSVLQHLLSENETGTPRQENGINPGSSTASAQPHHGSNTAAQAAELSPAAQRLLADASREVHRVAEKHNLPWDQGMDNTVAAVAQRAHAKGMTEINLFAVKNGEIRFGQRDGPFLKDDAVDGTLAANTRAADSLTKLAATDQQLLAKENAPAEVATERVHEVVRRA